MNRYLAHDMIALGHLAHKRQLRRFGHSPATVRAALVTGELMVVRSGWIADVLAPQSAVEAVVNGGKLTSTSALSHLQVWSGEDRRLHVQFDPHSHPALAPRALALSTFSADRFPMQGIVRHWTSNRWPEAGGPSWRVSALDALLDLASSGEFEQIIASVESAIYKKAIRHSQLPLLFAALPARLSGISGELNLLAESGLESIARLRMKPLRVQIECQVKIPGIGRVDILINGWLVIEIIGDEFHTPAGDRARMVDIIRAGYRGLFLGYQQVMFGWDECEAAIRELLREGRVSATGR